MRIFLVGVIATLIELLVYLLTLLGVDIEIEYEDSP